jgi:multidrug resistance efflux pump
LFFPSRKASIAGQRLTPSARSSVCFLPKTPPAITSKIVQRVPVRIVLEPGENRDLSLRPGMNVVPDVFLQ